jgi:hypothetical protein
MQTSETQNLPEPEAQEIAGTLRIERRGRYWAVYDGDVLICITVYKRGAREVVRRLRLQI